MAAAARRYQWSSFLHRTAGRTGLSRSFPNHHLLLRNSRAPAIMNNLCSNGLAAEASDGWQQQQQQRFGNNSFGVAAAAASARDFKVVTCLATSLSSSLSRSLSSSSSSSYPPVLMLPSTDLTSKRKEVNYGAFFSLRDHKAVKLQKYLPEQIMHADCKGSSRGWLVYVNRRDCSIYLADLFSSSSPFSTEIVPLPSIFTLPQLKEVNPCFPHKILEYELDRQDIERYPSHISSLLIRRLSISSSPIAPNNAAAYNLNRDCVVMVCPLAGLGLSFCRIGDATWTPLLAGGPKRADDIVYSKKDNVFYSVTIEADGRKFHAWDFNNGAGGGLPKRTDFDIDFGDIVEPDYYCYEVHPNVFCTKYYLVESPEGEILYLERSSVYCSDRGNFFHANDFPSLEENFAATTAFFAAYRLDFEKQIAVPVESLGDTALFVGFNESFSLPTCDHPELRPNSIYFTDDKYLRIFADYYYYGGDDIGIYNFEDYSLSRIYGPSHSMKIRPPPIWVSMSRP